MSTSLIRPFQATDKTGVIDLWRACGLLRSWNDPSLDIQRKQAVGAELFLVCEKDQLLIGSVMGGYDGHRGWMNYLAVAPDRQGLGIGRQLVEALENRLITTGCPKLNLQVRTGNEAVLHFYAKLGYNEDAVVSLGKRLIAD